MSFQTQKIKRKDDANTWNYNNFLNAYLHFYMQNINVLSVPMYNINTN